MDRKEFLTTIRFSLMAVCGGACLASCSKSDATSTPGTGTTTPPAGVNFAVDLGTEITNVGDSVAKNGVIVVRLATGSAVSAFTAVQLACTHQGTSIDFNKNKGNFVCPNHGSEFSTAGAVLNGPATASLKKYNIAVTGSTLTVTA